MNSQETATPSLTRSLGRVNSIGIAVALVISSVVLLVYQVITSRAALTEAVQLHAAIAAENVTAALMFGDAQAAADVLGHLRSLPYIESAAIFDRDGARFVLYARDGTSDVERDEASVFAAQHRRRLSFEDVFVSAPVELHGQHLGTVVLVATTEQMKAQFGQYAAFLFGALGCALWIARFVTKRMKARLNDAERQLEYLALTDPLTNLPNRRAFFEELGRRLRARPRGQTHMTLVLIDLDDFKTVNDTLGHGAGDELLRSVARTLKRAVRATDLVSRIGGDEFVVVASDHREKQQSQASADNIVHALARPFELQGRTVQASASVGFSRYPEDADTVPALLSNADIALYAAKSSGKNVAVAFRSEMTIDAQRRARLAHDLRIAIDEDRLDVVYQPQFDCRTGMLCGAEALVRWEHPTDGSIAPAEFVGIAEGSDLIVSLGMWVLKRATRDALRWSAVSARPLTLAVNVSARQLRQPQFWQNVLRVVCDSGFPAQQLELELTESLLMENVNLAADVMTQLRAAGVRLSIDDFGTGYSSLAYLQRFPINQLKIDRSFVRPLPDSGQPIVTAIISMAHSFGLNVVAEGVESPAQLEWLVDAQCDIVQGFLTGRPTSAAAIVELVRNQRGAGAREQADAQPWEGVHIGPLVHAPDIHNSESNTSKSENPQFQDNNNKSHI